MRPVILALFFLSVGACHLSQEEKSKPTSPGSSSHDSVLSKSYTEIKEEIVAKRKHYATEIYFLTDSIQEDISDYWVNIISNDLYSKWQNTPWDFNGITTTPQQGAIACGYFVTIILQDMNLSINRIKLSTCTSSEMMKSLTPGQKLKNLSYLSYPVFNDTLKALGKGVYIIGLDFHTGFIVNDGTENWFIHSNYIGRKGVTKERVIESVALISSKTRWLISLTNDKAFLQKWLKG